MVVSRYAAARFDDTEVFSNGRGGIWVQTGGKLTLGPKNVIRDHAGGMGFGVYVMSRAKGECVVLPNNALFRNAAGNICREGPPEPAREEAKGGAREEGCSGRGGADAGGGRTAGGA